MVASFGYSNVTDAFNYSRLMNLAAREVDTPLMLHLNNDVEAITPGWLEQMQGWLTLPGIGVVGPKLLYPDGSIQHAGVMVVPQLGASAPLSPPSPITTQGTSGCHTGCATCRRLPVPVFSHTPRCFTTWAASIESICRCSSTISSTACA